MVQAFGFVAISAALVLFVNRFTSSVQNAPLAQVYGFSRCETRFMAMGLFGGLIVGIFPGWLVEQVKRGMPELDLGTIDLINQLFEQASGAEYVALVLTLVLVAPLTEEVVFRGFMWHSCKRFATSPIVWILTTLLFSLYHMSLVQSLALLVTGGFIGWLRWTSGSIWPAIAAHFTNNLFATIAVISGAATGAASIPGWSACLTGLFTLGLCAYAWHTRVSEH